MAHGNPGIKLVILWLICAEIIVAHSGSDKPPAVLWEEPARVVQKEPLLDVGFLGTCDSSCAFLI